MNIRFDSKYSIETETKELLDFIKSLSEGLTKEFGKGFSKRNLEQMRQFYLVCSKSQITQTSSAQFKLSWSHYLKLMRMGNENERYFYEIESATNAWSLKELERQYDSGLYLRLSLSRDKEGVKQLSKKGQIVEKPRDTIKDPYILEFLDLPEETKYSESELKQEIILIFETMNSKEENYFKKIGEKIKELRESKDLEQKGFAFDCEIGRTQL